MKEKKLRVMVLYGGRSGEHEVSLRSAASVIHQLDPRRYEVVPVAIDRDGKWYLNSLALIQQAKAESLPVYKDVPSVMLPPYPGGHLENLPQGPIQAQIPSEKVDVVFPVMHGTFCEDGTIQGFLELADIPYVGSGVLASAVGMDKEIAKRLAKEAGIPIVPYVPAKKETWAAQRNKLQERIEKELHYPVFVKPVNSGSSLGVHKVKKQEDLEAAVQDAFLYDSRILIERAMEAREIELSVLESLEPGFPARVSVAGEIAPTHEFYTYEAKYLDEKGAKLIIPAVMDDRAMKTAQKLAQDVFATLQCEGMARVDLFMDKKSGEFYFNEINTLPGFTSISMYPKLWEHSGLPYSDLLSQLIELAIARHRRKPKGGLPL